MSAFRPCAALRARIDDSPVRNGQLIVAVDTGELFFDYNGRRIPLSTGGGGAVPEDSGFTGFAIVNGDLRRSASVFGGGAGAGLTGAPVIELGDAVEADTAYPII